MTLIQSIQVDVLALRGLAHHCDPARCGLRGACCTQYEILLEPHEIPTIIGVAPHASKRARTLVQHGEFVDFFDETPDGTCLNTDEDGVCIFAYRRNAYRRKKSLLCSLHTAALDLELPPAEIKPYSCSLWPLGLSEDDPPLLTVQPGALDFPCNTPRPNPPATLHPGIADILQTLFGQGFLSEVENA